MQLKYNLLKSQIYQLHLYVWCIYYIILVPHLKSSYNYNTTWWPQKNLEKIEFLEWKLHNQF